MAEAEDDTKDKLEKTERELAIERASRAELERRGTTTAAENARLKDQLGQSQKTQVDTTVSSLEAEKESLKKQYSTALSEGDFDKAADIQSKMGDVSSRLTLWSMQKQNLENAPKPTATAPASGAVPTGGTIDKEQFLSTVSAPTAAWLRKNDAYFTDNEFRSKATRAHHAALAEGLNADSADYFNFIERDVGLQKADNDTRPAAVPAATPAAETTTREAVRKPGQKPAPSVAPSREAAGSTARVRPGDTYIAPNVVAAAKLCDIPPEQYLAEYKVLVNEGKIGDHLGVFKR